MKSTHIASILRLAPSKSNRNWFRLFFTLFGSQASLFLRVWNAVTGAVLYTYNGYNVQAAINPSKGVLPDLIFAVAWSHNGKRIAAITQVYCGDVCAVVLGWDAYTQSNFTFWVDEPVFAMAWSPDDTRLVTSIVNSEQGTEHLSVQPPDGNFAQISQA